MATVLKIKYQSDVHRVPLEVVTFDVVQSAVQNLYPERLAMQYLDGEGDRCALCPSTFSDFVVATGAGVGGKTVLRLELSPPQPAPPAAAAEKDASSSDLDLPPLLGLLKGKDRGRRFGKGERPPASDPAPDSGDSGAEGPPRLDAVGLRGNGRFRGMLQLATAFRQLHESGRLSARTAAAVVVTSFGKLISVAADHAEIIDLVATANPETLRKVFEELLPHTVAAKGLENCAVHMEALLAGDDVSASQVLLELLAALDSLTFGGRMAFMEGLFDSQQHRIDELMAQAGPLLALLQPTTAERPHIACDGCGESPLLWPRFKCKSLDDFDLCADCFASKDTVDGGRCAVCEFETSRSPTRWRARLGGPGGGGERGSWDEGARATEDQPGSVVHMELGGLLELLKGRGKGKRTAEEAGARTSEAGGEEAKSSRLLEELDRESGSSSEMADDPTAQPHLDVHVPVSLEDGRCLAIECSLGDDPQQVSREFAVRHDVMPEEFPPIQAFLDNIMTSVRETTK